MAGTSLEWEVENVDNEAALKSRLSALRTAGTTGDLTIMWNSTLGKFVLVYLKPA
jgi:hypothetical protein